jgi:hypothetical protein
MEPENDTEKTLANFNKIYCTKILINQVPTKNIIASLDNMYEARVPRTPDLHVKNASLAAIVPQPLGKRSIAVYL